LPRVYVPNLRSNDVYVIDPDKLKVVDRFRVGGQPQHIVPSWDLKTLWVNNNGLRGLQGSLTPIDPKTGKPGQSIAVEDPYKLYLTERKVVGHLNLIRPNLITQAALELPDDQRLDAAFCGIGGIGAGGGMPQDIRVSPDGKLFFIADMMADGVYLVDGDEFKQVGYIPTGTGTHGLYPSRDGTKLYVANRGSHDVRGKRRGPGSIAVVDFATREVVA